MLKFLTDIRGRISTDTDSEFDFERGYGRIRILERRTRISKNGIRDHPCYVHLTCWRPTNCWPNTRVNRKFRANINYVHSLSLKPMRFLLSTFTHYFYPENVLRFLWKTIHYIFNSLYSLYTPTINYIFVAPTN